MADELSVGTKLGYGATPTNLAKIVSMSLPSGGTADVETTDYDIEGAWKTFVAGNRDPGQITATIKFDPSNFADILDQVRVSQDWTITFPSGATLVCDGYLHDPGLEFEDADDDGLVTLDIEIKLSGAKTFTAGGT